MKTVKPAYASVFLGLAVFLAGCAAPQVRMYSGPPKAADQQAEIKAVQPSTGGRLSITAVDGKGTVNFFTFLFSNGRWPLTAYVLPGKRTFRARLDFGNFFSQLDLWWVAEAGAVYVVKSQSVERSVRMWIENERTGEKVGGPVGSPDEPAQ